MILPGEREGAEPRQAPPPREGGTGAPLSHRRLCAPGRCPGARDSGGEEPQPCAASWRGEEAARRSGPVGDHLLRGTLPRHAGFGTGAGERRGRSPSAQSPRPG